MFGIRSFFGSSFWFGVYRVVCVGNGFWRCWRGVRFLVWVVFCLFFLVFVEIGGRCWGLILFWERGRGRV